MTPARNDHHATTPAISVIVPVRDGRDTISRALCSVAAAGGAEVVVVDDGSTDGSVDDLPELDGCDLVVRRQEGRGVSAARNTGAAAASANMLCFLDCDDELLPGALDRFREALAATGAPFVRAGMVMDKDGSRSSMPALPPSPGGAYPRGAVPPGTYVVDRDVFEAVGGYDERLRHSENVELQIRILQHVRSMGVAVPVMDAASVLIHRRDEGRAARYGSAPAEAARFMLDRYHDELAREAGILADYHAIIGTDLLRRGQRADAARELAASLRYGPRSAKAWLRLASVGLPKRLRPNAR